MAKKKNFKITNISGRKDAAPARNVYLIECAQMLQPGHTGYADRLQEGTQTLEKEGVLKIESGKFAVPEASSPTAGSTTADEKNPDENSAPKVTTKDIAPKETPKSDQKGTETPKSESTKTEAGKGTGGSKS